MDEKDGAQMGTHLDMVNEAIVCETILQTLMTNDKRPGKQAPGGVERLPKEKVVFLVSRVSILLQKESTLLELEPPLTVLGDTHGQFADLLDIIDSIGWPPNKRFLFMGDYVDRGDQSVELICLVYLLKIQHPENFFVLRGNHETAEINSEYGFKEDCLIHYDIQTWDTFQESFKRLPLAALIGSRILCMHGGLSPSMLTLSDIRKIPRPVDIPDIGLTCDILWSDPTPAAEHPALCGFTANRNRHTSVWFCQDIVNDFLKRNDLELIVRGHEVSKQYILHYNIHYGTLRNLVLNYSAPNKSLRLIQKVYDPQVADNGYKFAADKKVLTLFSAPYYCDHPNNAAALHVDEELRCQITVFKFKKTPAKHPAAGISSDSSTQSNIVNPELWNEVIVRKPTC